MNSVFIKSFIQQKDSIIWSCQDSIAIDTIRNRFAIADGITNSYHPEVFSQLLCQYYIEKFDEVSASFTYNLPMLCTSWERKIDNLESMLSGRKLQHARIKRSTLPAGASTFAGIEIDIQCQICKYHIIGDSTLFIINNDRMKAICSNNQDTTITNIVQYDDYPDCICADGTIKGDIMIGQEPLQDGFILLMTDGMAKWFQNEYEIDRNVVEQLWTLANNEDFLLLTEKYRINGNLDDDLALIIMKVNKPVKACELVYAPQIPPIVIINKDNQ